MTLSRRGLLVAGTALAALSACTSADSAALQKLRTEANALVSGFGTALAAVTPTVGGALVASLQTYLSDIQTGATAIAAVASTAAAVTPVGQIMTAVSGFASVLPTLALPPTVATTASEIIAAAEVVIPIMAAAVGLAGASAGVAPVLSEPQALAILTRGH